MPGWHRSLRLVSPLVARAAGTWPHRAIDATGLREALRQTAEERHSVTASEIYMRQSEPPCSRKSAVPRGIFGSLASSNGAQPIDRAEVQALSETTRLCLLSLVCEPSVPAPRPRLPSRSNTPCSPREPPG